MEIEEEIIKINIGNNKLFENEAEGSNQELVTNLNITNFEIERPGEGEGYSQNLGFENPLFNRGKILYNKLVPGFTRDNPVDNLITLCEEKLTIHSIHLDKVKLVKIHQFSEDEKNDPFKEIIFMREQNISSFFDKRISTLFIFYNRATSPYKHFLGIQMREQLRKGPNNEYSTNFEVNTSQIMQSSMI